MTDAQMNAYSDPMNCDIKYGGRWWRCGAVMSLPGIGGTRERFYLISRGSEVARVEAMQVEAVRERKP